MPEESAARFRKLTRAVLKKGARLSFRAGGMSMSPFIRNNETVIVEPPVGTLRIGDVILFARGDGQLTLHRILKKTMDGYVTRGDANTYYDGAVPHNAVLGRAVHVAGGLNFHLRYPLSMFVALALRLRAHAVFFRILRMPGSLLLRRLRSQAFIDSV